MVLSGCSPDALDTRYAMNFYGRSIDPTTGNSQKMYELTDQNAITYQISVSFKSVEDHKKEMESLTLALTNKDTQEVYLFEDIIFGQHLSELVPLPRAKFTVDNTLMVYLENWRTSLVAGYINGKLAWTDVVEIDLERGEILDSWKAGKNEFIITNGNGQIYIYNLGKLYTRNLEDWDAITEIANLGLEDIKAEDILALFFEVDDSGFRLYKSQQYPIGNSTDTIIEKELLATVNI